MRWLAVVFVWFVCTPSLLRAQADRLEFGPDEEVKVDADSVSYDRRADTMTARGNVVIRRGMTELCADEVVLNQATNEADARGNVSLSDPEGVMFAEAMKFNLDDETAALTGAALKSKRLQYSLWGSRIEKGLGQSYHIANGRFTTCNCEDGRQSWSISGKSLDISVDGYGIVQGASFNVLDVPILYVPKMLIPVQRERQSGFLMPRFGFSNTRGFQTLLPFYWALNKSHDVTLGFDVETSARIGGLAEYRYALERGSTGTITGSYFNEFLRGNSTVGSTTAPMNRWSVATDQKQAIWENGLAYTDLNIVSDDLFFREINTYAFEHAATVAIRTLPFTTSRVGAVQVWDHAAAKLEGTYYQNLGDSIESQTLQVAPRLNAWGQVPLGSLALADFSTEAADFQRSQGPAGGRLDVEPGLTFPIPMENVGFGSVRVAGRETGYLLSDDRLGEGPSTLKDQQHRETFQVRGEAGTIFQRIYDVDDFGFSRVKHTIEPTVGYFYVPNVAQGELPLWDGIDRINNRNLATYGVTTRFVGKPQVTPDLDPTDDSVPKQLPPRELARFSLTQSYDLSRTIPPVKLGAAADHFSDIDFAGRLNPNRYLSFRFLTNFDTSSGDFSSTRVGLFVEDPRERDDTGPAKRLDTRTSAGLSYRFLTNNQLQQVDANMVLRLTDWAGFMYASRYNVVTNQFLDNFFGLRLISSCDCWALDIVVTNRTNPNETGASAQLTLVGLSSAKRARRVAVMP